MNPLRLDPSRTASIRRRAIADMRRRLRALRKRLRTYLLGDQVTTHEEWDELSPDEKKNEFKEEIAAGLAVTLLALLSSGASWLEEYVKEAWEKGVERTYTALGLEPADVTTWDFIMGDTEAVRDFLKSQLAVETYELLVLKLDTALEGVEATIKARLMAALMDNIGVTAAEMAAIVSDALDAAETSMLRLIRTEIVRAQAEGQLDVFEQSGRNRFQLMVEWRTSAGNNVCPQCQMRAGHIYTLAEARGLIPLHINCVFAGSTFVSYGKCQQLVRAWYCGPAVVLSLRSGLDGTTVGPNHPVMTRRGMIRAAELREGDEVLYDLRKDFSFPANLNNKQVPTIENVFSTNLASPSVVVAASGSDLHGDRKFCQGEVDGIEPALGLLPVRDSFGIEQFRKHGFKWSNVGLFYAPRLCPHQLGLDSICLSSPGFMGGRSVESSLFGSHLRVAKELGFASASGRPSILEQPAIYDTSYNFELLCNLLGAVTRIEQVADFICINGNPVFRWVQIEQVGLSTYEGWVFDASTETGIYCSDSLVVNNCQCSWAYV